MEFDVMPIYNMVVGLYLCATLMLGVGLCFAARLSPFNTAPPPQVL